MDVFKSAEFQLLRLAARFRSEPDARRRGVNTEEVAYVVEKLMGEGWYFEEFAYLDDPKLNYFEMLPVMKSFLLKLKWQPLDDEGEFRFMTALYSQIGQQDDVSAYFAICRWMDEVGCELDERFHRSIVADGIGAEKIYGCYYSYSNVTGGDLIPGVDDPSDYDWSAEGGSRPMTVFAEWLMRHPRDFKSNQPIDTSLLVRMSA